MHSRRRFGGWLLSAVVSVASGCLAPTLPVPPPERPEITAPDANGLVTLRGGKGAARGNAEVSVWNPAEKDGDLQVADADGAYVLQVKAQPKATLYLWQTIGFDRSTHIELVVPSK